MPDVDLRRWRGIGTRIPATLAVCVLLAVAPGCNDDSGSSGLTASCITFIPAQGATPGEVTSVWGSESTCDTVEVELEVSGVDDIWSAEFEVVYPVSVSQFLALSTGDSFLLEGTDTLVLEAQEIVPGRVEIGVSRVDSSSLVGVTPTDNTHLCRLIFRRFASGGGGDVTLEDANLSRVVNLGDPPTPFDPAIVFSGGTFFIEN
jgi:hypothetical protein